VGVREGGGGGGGERKNNNNNSNPNLWPINEIVVEDIISPSFCEVEIDILGIPGIPILVDGIEREMSPHGAKAPAIDNAAPVSTRTSWLASTGVIL